MARNRQNEYRDPVTKRFAYYGNFDRMCECGHRLGAHVAGGFECIDGEHFERIDGKPCGCQKFRPAKKKG